MIDLIKTIDDSPIRPVWKTYFFTDENGGDRSIELLIQPLETSTLDVLNRKSTVKKKDRRGKIVSEQSQTLWRQLAIKTCLKDWRGVLARDVLRIANAYTEGISQQELDAVAPFNIEVAMRLLRNPEFAIFIQNAAMEMIEGLTEEIEVEKKTSETISSS